ncbi:MAG TPA: hypothetical protein VGM07_07155 [Stellaceae bacterium]|jgi:hypothetical protein
MTATAWRLEVRSALVGCLRLAKGDRRGLAYFDRTLDGFWRSFLAGVLSYPLYLFLLTTRVSLAQWQAAGGVRVVLVETIAYVIAWVAFPLIMLSVLRWIGREHRFFDFMVPYNWSQLPQSLLFVLVGLDSASGLLGDPIAQALEVAAAIAVLVYEWYIARVALQTTGLAATLVVLVDLVLGLIVSRAAGSLY